MITRFRKRLAHVLDRRFFALHDRVEDLATRVEDLARAEAHRDIELRALVAAINARVEDEVAPALRIMAGNDAENRRLLDAARRDSDYELAFVEPEPLVTVIMPTYRRAALLGSRALPSVLGQTHERLEVLVIGDATDPETEAVVRDANDSRVAFVNLRERYVYPDERRHRLAASTLTRNEGYRLARGRWLFDVDDDDAVPSDAVECLLDDARERKLEAVQGVIRQHTPDGRVLEDRPQHFSLSGAVVHAHLRFFGREHVASAFGVGGDVFRGERMLRAGVRIGRLDRVTYEYYPAVLWE